MMSGLPGSGKSTIAQEKIAASGGSMIRLNRDLIRTMLHFDKWSGKNESATIDAQMMLARHFLMHGVGVIIDDTNLGDSHKQRWQGIAKECNATFQHQPCKTDIQICIERDEKREKKVGRHVILQMAMQYGLAEKPKKGYVICDIDGTVADIQHRRHFLEGEKKDWKSFFEAMHADTPRSDIINEVQGYHIAGYDVVFVSGRPDNYRAMTEEWLDRHVGLVLPPLLIMRRHNDGRPDTEVKKQILDTYFPDRGLVKLVIDDRPSVIRMWRENGLEVKDVGDGIEF